MLKETLEKMKAKIENANDKWESENNDAINSKRFDEFMHNNTS